MTTKETLALFEKYVIANYTREPIVFVHGLAGEGLLEIPQRRVVQEDPHLSGLSLLGTHPPRRGLTIGSPHGADTRPHDADQTVRPPEHGR